MATMVLDPTPAPPAAEPCVPGLNDVPDLPGLVGDAGRLLETGATVPVDGLDDEALGAAIGGLVGVESRAAALRMALMAEADRRRVAEQTAETGTDAWVARLTGSTREQAAGGLRLAGLVQDKYPATRAAFAAGDLRVEQVRVIVAAAEQAPVEATAAQVAAAEEWLVARATGAGTRSGRGLDASRLRQAARRMFAHLDPALADRHQAILLGRETRTAQAETFLALHDNGDGPGVDESAPGGSWGTNRYQTHGAAWCELIEHLPTRGWPGHGGNACEVIVTIDLDTLTSGRSGLGAAGLDGGVAITAGQARRLACTAGLVPAVLDGASMPLDLGRARRLHTKTQRRALALLHDTRAIAGCTRPFSWCEIHHPHPWSRGGPTDLDNALPLCGYHHQRAHETRYDLRQRPDGQWTLRPRR